MISSGDRPRHHHEPGVAGEAGVAAGGPGAPADNILPAAVAVPEVEEVDIEDTGVDTEEDILVDR